MPVIRVDLLEGRSVDQKRELVETLSRETSRIAGCSIDAVTVIIQDFPKTSWGSGGELLADRSG